MLPEITLQDYEFLYSLGTEDPDTTSYLTTWLEEKPMRWFFAVMVGDIWTRPYWDTPIKDHKILAVFADRKSAREYMLKNLQPNIYLSFGWIITKTSGNQKEK